MDKSDLYAAMAFIGTVAGVYTVLKNLVNGKTEAEGKTSSSDESKAKPRQVGPSSLDPGYIIDDPFGPLNTEPAEDEEVEPAEEEEDEEDEVEEPEETQLSPVDLFDSWGRVRANAWTSLSKTNERAGLIAALYPSGIAAYAADSTFNTWVRQIKASGTSEAAFNRAVNQVIANRRETGQVGSGRQAPDSGRTPEQIESDEMEDGGASDPTQLGNAEIQRWADATYLAITRTALRQSFLRSLGNANPTQVQFGTQSGWTQYFMTRGLTLTDLRGRYSRWQSTGLSGVVTTTDANDYYEKIKAVTVNNRSYSRLDIIKLVYRHFRISTSNARESKPEFATKLRAARVTTQEMASLFNSNDQPYKAMRAPVMQAPAPARRQRTSFDDLNTIAKRKAYWVRVLSGWVPVNGKSQVTAFGTPYVTKWAAVHAAGLGRHAGLSPINAINVGATLGDGYVVFSKISAYTLVSTTTFEAKARRDMATYLQNAIQLTGPKVRTIIGQLNASTAAGATYHDP